ncbi:tetratricopeptide repeat protein [Peterkaempfera griseoplana]|uniref:tetratricopeptide repeat protein n=1 Tax=Peterkaempfera griseoplana TaxID=66896 RepID=UPI0006E46C5C|nr:tetratricopeptide repeat protein [Peterkaempfera griseoplana]
MTRGRERAQDRNASGGPGGGAAGTDGPGDGGEDPRESVYEWFRRGSRLLAQGSAAAAVQLLERAAAAEPESRSIRETLARAQFDAGSYAAALENFREVALADPSDDYAQFGWGLAAARMGDFEASAEHLALAVAMRPESDHYRAALRQTRATLRARAGAFGPVPPHPRWPGPQDAEPGGPRSNRQEEQE